MGITDLVVVAVQGAPARYSNEDSEEGGGSRDLSDPPVMGKKRL